MVSHLLVLSLVRDVGEDAAIPNPRVWIFPADESLDPSNFWVLATGGQRQNSTADPRFRIRLFGNRADDVEVRANDVARGQVDSVDPSLYSIDLRRGRNRIAAQVRAPTPGEPIATDQTALTVTYRPCERASPRIVGAARDPADRVTLLGFAEPGETLTLSAGTLRQRVTTGSLGEFTAPLPLDRQASLTWTVGYPETSRPNCPSSAQQVPTTMGMAVPEPGATQAVGFRRSLRITIQNDRLLAKFELAQPSSTVLGEFLAQGQIAASELSRQVFGVLSRLQSNAVAIDAPESNQVQGAEASIVARWDYESDRPDEFAVDWFAGAGSQVPGVLNWPGGQVVADEETARRLRLPLELAANVRTEDGLLVWEGRYRASGLRLGPVVPRAGVVPADRTVVGRLLPGVTAFVTELHRVRRDVPTWVRASLELLLTVLAFAWALWSLAGPSAPARRIVARPVIAIALCATALHVALFAPHVLNINYTWNTRSVWDYLQNLAAESRGQGLVLAAIALVAALTRLALSGRFPPRRRTVRGAAASTLWGVAALIATGATALAFLVATVEARGGLGLPPSVQSQLDLLWFDWRDRTGTPPSLLLGVGGLVAFALCVAWIPLRWLVRVAVGPGLPLRACLAASWIVIFLPLLPLAIDSAIGGVRLWSILAFEADPWFAPRGLGEVAWPVVTYGTLAVLIYGMAGAVLPAVALGWLGRARRKVGRGWLFAAAVVATLPLSLPSISLHRIDQTIFTIAKGAEVIAPLLRPALAAALVVWLRRVNPADRLELRPGQVAVGTLIFAYFLGGGSANLLFIPIPMLVAAVMFRALVSGPTPVPDRAAADAALQNLLDHARARRLRTALASGLEKKYAQGDISLADMRAKLEGSEQNERAAAALLGPAGRAGATLVAFGHGPESGPWANARVAVAYGTVIALPLMLRAFIADDRPWPDALPLLIMLLGRLAYAATSWVLMAFLFGYFFHVIRGRSGIEKALWFSLALAVPNAAFQIVIDQPLLSQSHLYRIVETSTFVLVLGLLAFDLRRIASLGHSWRELLAVHGLVGMTAYGSTIIASLAASIASKDVLLRLVDLLKSLFGA